MIVETGNRNAKVLRDFIEEYLLTARRYLTRFQKKDALFGCDDPCQVNIIWFERPSVQVLAFTHIIEKPDMLIQVSGPHYASEAMRVLEDVLSTSSWLKEYMMSLPDDHRTIAREIVESDFLSTIRTIQKLIERGEQKRAIHRSTQELPAKAVIWTCEGFLPTSGIRRLCDELGVSSPPSSGEDETYSHGWGTFYYPPLLLGAKPKQKFAQRVRRKRPALFDKRSYVGNCGGYQVYVGREGFIGVLCKERARALTVLNTIFAFSLAKGIETFPVLPSELQDIRYNLATQSFDIVGSPLVNNTLRTSQFQDIYSYSKIFQRERLNVSRVKIRRVVKCVDEIIADKEITKLLRLFHESYTHMINHQHNSAFTLAWTIIESWISKQWISYLRSKNLSANNIHKLEDWNIDALIQSLSLSGHIKQNVKNALDTLRMKRNKIIHRGQFAKRKDVERCIRLAFEFLQKYITFTKLALPAQRRLRSKRPKPDEGFFRVELVDDLF